MGLVVTTHTNNYLYKGLNMLAQKLPPERHAEIVPLRALVDAGVKERSPPTNAPVSNSPTCFADHPDRIPSDARAGGAGAGAQPRGGVAMCDKQRRLSHL